MVSREQAMRATVARISDAKTVHEINDAIGPTYRWQELAGKRLTIRSVKARPSDHRSESYVVVGFSADDVGSGVFLVSTGTARYLLTIEEWKFPVCIILHKMIGQNGHPYPRVERVS